MTDPDSIDPVEALLAAAYELDGPDANRALYAQWAETYESGFVADSRYVYQDHVAQAFATLTHDSLTPHDVVIDVGCGTGLAGAALRQLLVVVIDGLDISTEMLHQAEGKRYDGQAVYRNLIEADLTQTLTIEDNAYAGALSVGTFTHGHVGPSALDEIIRIVRPGGHVAIGINAAHYTATNFGLFLDEQVATHRITNLELIVAPIYDGADASDPDKIARIATFQIN